MGTFIQATNGEEYEYVSYYSCRYGFGYEDFLKCGYEDWRKFSLIVRKFLFFMRMLKETRVCPNLEQLPKVLGSTTCLIIKDREIHESVGDLWSMHYRICYGMM